MRCLVRTLSWVSNCFFESCKLTRRGPEQAKVLWRGPKENSLILVRGNAEHFSFPPSTASLSFGCVQLYNYSKGFALLVLWVLAEMPRNSTSVPTIADLRLKSCWVCLESSTEVSDAPLFVHPCKCSLLAHRTCLNDCSFLVGLPFRI